MPRLITWLPITLPLGRPAAQAESADGVRLDVCVNTDDGPQAAAWLAAQCAAFPVLRPLCLALKALLADQKLADASQGGLR